jgi:transcriptional regulator with GAF, ATPase, and Fis domain
VFRCVKTYINKTTINLIREMTLAANLASKLVGGTPIGNSRLDEVVLSTELQPGIAKNHNRLVEKYLMRQVEENGYLQVGSKKIVGSDWKMLSLYRIIFRLLVSKSTAPVLLTGETGTGKELVARALHHYNTRSAEEFVPINCAAIQDEMIESELFGAVKGAYTGSEETRLGLFDYAKDGTLYLDEIAEMSRAMQTKLLRALDTGEIKSVGSTDIRVVKPRIIAATNKDLDELVEKGKFRQDLYHRLNIVKINLPTLRSRKNDIKELLLYFIKRTCGKEVEVPQDVFDRAIWQRWPGNVRELEHFVEREHIMGNIEGLEERTYDLSKSLFQNEVEYLVALLRGNDYRAGDAATQAKICRSRIYRQLKKVGLSIEDMKKMDMKDPENVDDFIREKTRQRRESTSFINYDLSKSLEDNECDYMLKVFEDVEYSRSKCERRLSLSDSAIDARLKAKAGVTLTELKKIRYSRGEEIKDIDSIAA